MLECKPEEIRRVCPPGPLLSSQSIAAPPPQSIQSLRDIGVTTKYRGFLGKHGRPEGREVEPGEVSWGCNVGKVEMTLRITATV